MADAERYVTADELQDELPFDWRDFPVQDSAAFSSTVERALGSASDMVEKWTGTVFVPETVSETFARPSTAPKSELPLSERPVQSVMSVRANDITLSEDDDWRLHPDDTHLVLVEDATIDEWPTDVLSVSVEYEYGYSEVPGPVHEAIARLARNRLDQIETDGVNTESSWQYRPPAKIKAECVSMVDDYSAPSYYGGAMIV